METFNVDNKLRLVYYQIKLNYDDAKGRRQKKKE